MRGLSKAKFCDKGKRLSESRRDNTLDQLRHGLYFSSPDLKSGYWQIEIDERGHEKIGFVTPDGFCEFKVMHFRLPKAPATFQRVPDSLLMGLK